MAYYGSPRSDKTGARYFEQVAVETTKTTECPVSAITPDIEFLNGQFQSNRLLVKSGGTLNGPDAGKWPTWWADVVEVCEREMRHANAIVGLTD